jgi:hypothetical protein
VVALARPEIDTIFRGLWSERDVQRITLAPLPRKAGERLVRAVLGSAVSAERVVKLVDQASGNAFYLEELIRFEAEGRGESLPETVLAMLEARLETLEPEARRMLRAASIFGEVFWEGGVTAIAGEVDRTSAKRQLDELVRQEVVTRRNTSRLVGDVEYAFRHALVREAAYAMLTDSDRALGHRLAAGWLESVGEVDAMVLAEHFDKGGARDRAARAYLTAAEEALRGNDLDAVLERAERAVTSGASGESLGTARWMQSEAYIWRGELHEARRRNVEALLCLPRGGANWCLAAGWMCWLLAQAEEGDSGRFVELTGELAGVEPARDAIPAYAQGATQPASYLYIAGQYAAGDAFDDEARIDRRSIREQRPDRPRMVGVGAGLCGTSLRRGPVPRAPGRRNRRTPWTTPATLAVAPCEASWGGC